MFPADQRYELFLNGNAMGRGPERGDGFHWHFESYDLNLDPGRHLLVARVWTLVYRIAPAAQISLQHGFLLAAESPWTETLSTGIAPWEAKKLEGYSFADLNMYAGGSMTLDGRRFAWNFESDSGEGWSGVQKIKVARTRFHAYGELLSNPFLRPAPLPAMVDQPVVTARIRHIDQAAIDESTRTVISHKAHLVDEADAWQKLVEGNGKLSIPAHTTRRVVIDLNDYYCGYARVTLSGGKDARLRLHWAEAALRAIPASPRRAIVTSWRARRFMAGAIHLSPMGETRANTGVFGGKRAATSKFKWRRRTSRSRSMPWAFVKRGIRSKRSAWSI